MNNVDAFPMTARDRRNQAELAALLLGLDDPSAIIGELSFAVSPLALRTNLIASVSVPITGETKRQLQLALPLTLEQLAARDPLPSQIRAKYRGRVLGELRAELEQLLEQTAADDPALVGIMIALEVAGRLQP